MSVAMSLLSETPPSAPTPAKDIGTKEFAQEVLKTSLQQPVLVDFWAPWCGPCKQLTPVLEKAVAATGGKVKLVKLNIDENQQLAAQMGIQSIPAVFAFYKGQPVDGFMGAQPENAIRAFLDKLIKISGGGAVGAAEAEVLAQANAALEQNDIETANNLFADILTANPSNASAYAGLIKVALAVDQTEEAQAMLDEAPEEIAKSKELDGVRAQLALASQAVAAGPVDDLLAAVMANQADHTKRYDLAVALHAANRSEEAIDHLLEIIKRERGWNEDAARKQLVTIFEALGLMHELTIAGRRKLSAILFK
jgi:putative thioredoxin